MNIVFHFDKQRGHFDKFLFQFLTELYNYLVSNHKKNQELIYLGVACCNIHRLLMPFHPIRLLLISKDPVISKFICRRTR